MDVSLAQTPPVAAKLFVSPIQRLIIKSISLAFPNNPPKSLS
jgi:hypothetical protein